MIEPDAVRRAGVDLHGAELLDEHELPADRTRPLAVHRGIRIAGGKVISQAVKRIREIIAVIVRHGMVPAEQR